MPWCPKCKTEYRPEIEICADCGEALVPDDPQPPAPAIIDGFWATARLLLAVFVAGISIVAACVASVGGDLRNPFPPAVAMGILCSGGILVSAVQPARRFESAFTVWIMAAAVPMLFFIISLADYLIDHPKVDHAQSDVETIGYLLAAAGIGAITSTTAGRWFSGQGHKHALTLLATTVAFVSSPYLILWWQSR